jgi:hypothetical protein
MKDCPANQDEPRGASYRRVNELIGGIPRVVSRQALIDRLGEPDEIREGQPNTPDEIQGLMNGLAGGESVIEWADPLGFEEILVYQDPYRPRRRYLFGVRNGSVTQRWQENSVGPLPPN